MHVTAARRLRLRLAIAGLCLIALPLYTAEEAVSRLKARPYLLPGRLVDRVDERLIRMEDRAAAVGDGRFTDRLRDWMERACNAVDTALTRLTGRA
jgi:hypothetical protein